MRISERRVLEAASKATTTTGQLPQSLPIADTNSQKWKASNEPSLVSITVYALPSGCCCGVKLFEVTYLAPMNGMNVDSISDTVSAWPAIKGRR